MERLEIIGVDLMEKNPAIVREVRRLCNLLGIGLGWHYMLDIVWILKQIDLPRGTTILDAGAGNGVLQFALAECGYDVISVDFSNRSKPFNADMVFPMRDMGGETFQHEYIEYMRSKGGRAKSMPWRIVRNGLNRLIQSSELSFLWLGRIMRLRRPGTITYYRTDMCNMEAVKDSTVDVVVSVSAIEHMEREKVPQAVKEFDRVLKPGGFMAITTSAARGLDWFHESSMGWCYTENSLREIFCLSPGCPSNFKKYDDLFKALCNCRELRDNLASFYFKSGNNGMPWGVWNPQYQPVGVMKPRPAR